MPLSPLGVGLAGQGGAATGFNGGMPQMGMTSGMSPLGMLGANGMGLGMGTGAGPAQVPVGVGSTMSPASNVTDVMTQVAAGVSNGELIKSLADEVVRLRKMLEDKQLREATAAKGGAL